MRAVLRRSSTAELLRERPIRVADVEIDPQRMRVTVDGRSVDLTPTEFQLLATLAREPGRVFYAASSSTRSTGSRSSRTSARSTRT